MARGARGFGDLVEWWAIVLGSVGRVLDGRSGNLYGMLVLCHP